MISELRRLMPPPIAPVEKASSADWDRAEAALGLRLPEDFKEFMSSYGVGRIGDFMAFFSPAASHRNLELVYAANSTLDAYRVGREPRVAGCKLHPIVPGVLPYGSTDNGNNFAWLTKGDSRDWPTIITASRGPEFVRRNASATTVLCEILGGDRRYKRVFPEDFPSGAVAFTPYSP